MAGATTSVDDPLPFWGSIDCETSSRAQRLLEGGDPSSTAYGDPQAGGGAFRRLTVDDGDEVWGGERCELGLNDHREGPTVFYHEGQHRVTYISLRLPSNFPLEADSWQSVMQMKQTQPSHETGGSLPVLSMEAFEGRWRIESTQGESWTFPAQRNRWTRFAWDVYYSQDAAKGWLQVSADLNGDGDFADSSERSPVIYGATLKTEAAGAFNANDELDAGDAIPSYLKVGISHDSSISCPGGCSLDLDNVQVIDASGATPVEPPAPQRTLTVSLAGQGDGTVIGSGISCPGDCSQTYADGTDVTLTATPAADGSAFTGWSGACGGSSTTCGLSMDGGNKGVVATFGSQVCPLGASAAGAPLGMTLSACKTIASDTSSQTSPLSFWGIIQCASQSRYSYIQSGGDPHVTAAGSAQPDSAFRRLTVDDGDEVWGERCELGLNDHRDGPTVFYHEGQHRATYISLRLPSNYPLSSTAWQTVMQMKQAQPADGGSGGPILEMQAREGKWVVINNWHDLWTFPAQSNKWTRFAWDVYYSKNPSVGWLQVSADLNGDGDFSDSGERSPVLHAATLKTEIDGPNGTSDGLAPGDPIPSHLRAGIYHSASVSCPAPTGCSTEVDNVQVLGP